MTDLPQNNLRPKRGSNTINYIKNFSATEKAIFGVFFIAIVISAIIMFSNASAHFSSDVPAYGGVLREGVIGLPRNVNPILAVSDVDRDLSTLIYSGLMKYNDKGKIVPDLAGSYKISNDGLTYTFKLKPNVEFQDGVTLTSEDVAFTIQKIQDPTLKSPRRIDWVDVTVKVVSPTEIEFILKQPYSPFLSNTTIGIIPKHIWGSVNDDQFIFSQYNTEPIGSGMYKISSISRDNGGIPTNYTLESWRGYYDVSPFIPSLTFNFFSDEETALVSLDQGGIDSLASVSPTSALSLADDKAQAYTILSTPLPRIFGVFFNQNQAKVLSDDVVRKALDTAIDRQNIIDVVLSGYGTPIYGPVPFVQSNSKKDQTGTSATSSIARAQMILEKDGWRMNEDGIYYFKNKSSTLLLSFDIYTADSPDLRRAAELVKETWTDMGAQVGLKVYEANDLYQNIIRPRKYDALLFGEIIGKDRDLYAFWHSSQRNAPGLNIALYANSKTDKLLENIRTISDENERAKKYEEFDKLVQADIPAIFLYMPDFIYAVPKAVKGMSLNLATPADRWNSIAKWYTDTERVWNIFIK